MNTNTNRNALRRAIVLCGAFYTRIRHLAPGHRTDTATTVKELLTDLGADLYELNHTILSQRYLARVGGNPTETLPEELLNQLSDLITVLRTARVPRGVATGLAPWIAALTDIHTSARNQLAYGGYSRAELLDEILGDLGDLAEQCTPTHRVHDSGGGVG